MEEITFNEIREGDELVVDYKGVAGRWLFAGCVLRVNVDERIGIGVARKGVRFKGMYTVIINGHAVGVKWLQSSTMRFWPMVQINKDISWETRRGAGDDYRTALIGGK